jgi:hypothetical protein
MVNGFIDLLTISSLINTNWELTESPDLFNAINSRTYTTKTLMPKKGGYMVEYLAS